MSASMLTLSPGCSVPKVVTEAVWGMIPKTKLGKAQIKKLKVYAGPDHPHQAQQPAPLAQAKSA